MNNPKLFQSFSSHMAAHCTLHPIASWWKLIYLVPAVTLVICVLVVWLTPNWIHNSRDGKKDNSRIVLSSGLSYFYFLWIVLALLVQPACFLSHGTNKLFHSFSSHMAAHCTLHPVASWWKLIYLVPAVTLVACILLVWLTPNWIHNSRDGKKDRSRIVLSSGLSYFYFLWIVLALFVQPACFLSQIIS